MKEIKNEELKISVVIPTYNRSHTLRCSIESLLNQTSGNWELIIIDDGSSDGTSDIINDYRDDKRIEYYYQEHQGVSMARNYGVSKTKNEFIIFLDSDDTFTPNLIQQLFTYQFFKYDIVCWEVLRRNGKNTKIGKPIQLGGLYNKITANFLAGCVCYKKSVFLKAGGYDPKISFGENYELGIRISWLDNLKIKIIESPFLIYTIKIQGRASYSLENRISSYIYQMEKHQGLYSQNIRAKSKMLYLIGFVLEKNRSYREALKAYMDSWIAFPLNMKSLIKILYLKIMV